MPSFQKVNLTHLFFRILQNHGKSEKNQPAASRLTGSAVSTPAAVFFPRPFWVRLPQNALPSAACRDSAVRLQTRIPLLPSSCTLQTHRAKRQIPPKFLPPLHPHVPPPRTPAPRDVPAAPLPPPPAPQQILCT